MHITIEHDACVGSGQCALAVPEVFDQDDEDGTVLLLDERPPHDLHEAVHEAAGLCPVQAILTAAAADTTP
ncbi:MULTISPECIES: ferredoxin [unclassified Streptomyces]|uniref:ferredoxin n=1 Tax=unclassified Streptomyces TaxID=2593676 RepID=UPI002E35FD35|nr:MULTISPECIES: ferredoxin [unclassified Streptomyces]WUC63580.1 ferredoxin [Streptomyces sp. NBC_00539]